MPNLIYLLPLLLFPLFASTQSPDYTSSPQFQTSILNSTNTYRSQHNASALSWNTTLSTFADAYVQACKFAHTGGPYGENLAAGYSSATAAVEAWGNEGAKYDFAAGQFSSETGHFTQLVWKATTTVGCGRANCSGENGTPGWYVVCEYWPRGNLIGNFTENVQQGSGDGGGSTSTSTSTSGSDSGSGGSSGSMASAVGVSKVGLLGMGVVWLFGLV